MVGEKMNLATAVKLMTAFEELRTELAQLRTLVSEPELLERLANRIDSEYNNSADAQAARDLAQRIRAWPLTPEQDVVE